MRWGNFTTLQTILINAFAWAAIQVLAGLAMARVPLNNFNRDAWIFRIRQWESDRIYERGLKIKKWKHLLPDGARVSRNGFRKHTLAGWDPEYLDRFARETLRAESTHWIAIPPFVFFFVVNIPSVAIWMPLYAFAVNAPCIAVQRYNRMRINRILKAMRARQSSAECNSGGENAHYHLDLDP